MSDVIGFESFVKSRNSMAPRSARICPSHQPVTFTPRDRQDLEDWASDDYRVSICSSEMGVFAMLYQAGHAWASWGVVRQGRSVLLWDCVTLADIGRFPSMIDALAAIPIDDFPAPVANVIEFAAVRARTATMG